jgi:hypothetical protein
MVVEIELSNESVEKLELQARQHRLSPGQLASLAVADFVRGPEADFEKAARYVLEKNQELLKRLSR